MTEDEGHLGADGAPAVSDETLRQYLLGRLEAEERLRLDESLLVDHQLAERIVLLESELTDDYAAGRLDSIDHAAFAERFLVTEDRKRQLSFTLALQDYSRTRAVAPVTQRVGPSWRERIAGLFSFDRPAWVIVGSAAVLILLVGLVWFVAKQQRRDSPLIARQEPPTPAVSPQGSPQSPNSRATTSPSPQPTRKPETTPSPATAPVTIASFVLLPGAARSGGELVRVAVPNGKRDVVRLSLVLEETPGAGAYQAELAKAEGQVISVVKQPKIEPGNRLVFDVPARLLPGGDYQINLSRTNAAGQTETLGRYYFRALKN